MKIDNNIWRIEKRNGKTYKVKWHDSLSYNQWRMIQDSWDLLGIFPIKKNEKRWKNKVIKNGLSDYIWGVEIKTPLTVKEKSR